MVFNSVNFALFFVVVLALYWRLTHRAQNVLLLVASYAFYAAWDWRFMGLLAATTLVTAWCGRRLGDPHAAGRGRTLVAGLAFNLLVLGFFKYYNFFADNLRLLFGLVDWRPDFFTLNVLLPIGISFYTFMAMSYLVDVYRREIAPAERLLDFGVFVAYFPHLVAGPILRASLLMPQIERPRALARAQVSEGGWLILWGLFKKMFVADNLARVAEGVFSGGAQPGAFDVLFGVYAFAFQIYGDFSGYTDIARGTSKLFGIELNLNFRFPYFVRSPQEFWAHWHISLSTWLRDYLFLPLSYAFSRWVEERRWLGVRDDVWTYAFATMVTMLLGGLWHGAAWTFVLWGAYQGGLLVVFQTLRMLRRRKHRRGTTDPLAPRVLGAIGMFHLTCLGWLIFRAESVGQFVDLLHALTTGPWTPSASWQHYGLRVLFYAGPLLALHGAEAARDDLNLVPKWRPIWRYTVAVALMYLIVLFGDFQGSEFIYFQF